MTRMVAALAAPSPHRWSLEARSVMAALLAAASCSGAIGDGDRGGSGRGDPAAGGGARPAGGAAGPTAVAPGASCGDVGHARMRRLTREQWASAVRDILALAAPPSTDGLVPDETVGVGPFRSNLVNALTDLTAAQYIEAAERVAQENVARLSSLVPCDRAVQGDDTCAEQFIDRIGLRAYRRPLSTEEKTRYTALFAAQKAAGYAEALRVITQVMLQSPNFLYHVEAGEPAQESAPGRVVALGGYALASRLSFYLWGSIPDSALFDAASSGKLNTPEGLRAQVDRMLKDPRARASVQSFHGQWLGIDEIEALSKDKAAYPAFTPALRDAMKTETLTFADHVIRQGDGKLDTLLTSSSSTIEGPLFALYGVQRPAGAAAGQLVPLDPSQRAGLLTHASFLAVHAHENQSSPILRGAAVREDILCQVVPAPPDAVPEPPEIKPGMSNRARFTLHKADPACASCHRLIDDIGFGFERYDGVGAYRATDGGSPVDARGDLTATRDADGPFDGAVELARRLARSQEVEECMVRQWFRFALGRPEANGDQCSIERARTEFAASGRNVRALISAVATSDAFRLRKTGVPSASEQGP